MGISKFKAKKSLKENALTLATLGGVICGIVLGLLLRLREEKYSAREAMYVQFIGKLFLSMLKMIILPLVIPSLIGKKCNECVDMIHQGNICFLFQLRLGPLKSGNLLFLEVELSCTILVQPFVQLSWVLY